MADDEWYNLQWKVKHPLVYWLNCENIEKPETSFMIYDADLSRFYFRLGRYSFLPQHCLLSCVITYQANDAAKSCFADLKTSVKWDYDEISTSVNDNFEFNNRSNYTFDFKIKHQDIIYEPKCLSISINIRPRNIKEQMYPVSQKFHPLTRWVARLSSDLGVLCELEQFHNVRIASFESIIDCRMHDYILKRRWPTLFKMHDPDIRFGEDIRIRTPISLSVLKKVLYFMYSGKMPENYNFRQHTVENAELTRVMDKYNLNNMYKVFVPQSRFIYRETLVEFEEKRVEVKLRYFDEDPVSQKGVPIQKFMRNGNQAKLYLSIEQEENAGFWLSYSLALYKTSGEPSYATLQIYTVGEVNSLLHCREYVLHLGKKTSSGPVIFLGSSNTFGNFVTDGKLRLRFKILASEVKLKHALFNTSPMSQDPPGYDFSIVELGMDMKEIYKSGYRFDCELVSTRSHVFPRQLFPAHKAIVCARIPLLAVASKIPVKVYQESIYHILHFVYTGRFESIPKSQAVKEDICKFCRRHRFDDLLDYARA